MLQVSVSVKVYVNIIYFNELFKVNVNVIGVPKGLVKGCDVRWDQEL